MALSILDGNQSATTLSSVVTGGEHIVAHSVVSLGSNAISNITTAISGSTVCVGNLGLLQSTVATEGLSASGSFIKIGGHTGTSTTGNIVHVSAVGALRVDGSVYTQPVSIASVTIGNTVTIAGTVTANAGTGTFIISDKGATGESTITTVTATSSFTLKAANTNRKLLTIYNQGAGTLNILYGTGTVTTANYSVKVFRGYYLAVDKYTGQVNGIFEKAGTARVTEIT